MLHYYRTTNMCHMRETKLSFNFKQKHDATANRLQFYCWVFQSTIYSHFFIQSTTDSSCKFISKPHHIRISHILLQVRQRLHVVRQQSSLPPITCIESRGSWQKKLHFMVGTITIHLHSMITPRPSLAEGVEDLNLLLVRVIIRTRCL